MSLLLLFKTNAAAPASISLANSDVATAVDASAATLASSNSLVETTQPLDAAAVAALQAANLADPATATDSTLGQATAARSLLDQTAAVDGQAVQSNVTTGLVETASAADSIAGRSAISEAAEDQATASDAQSTLLNAAAGRAEVATAADSAASQTAALQAVTDQAVASDASLAQSTTAQSLLETGTVTDSPSAVAMMVAVRGDTATALDAVVAATSDAPNVEAADAAQLQDSATASLTQSASRAETVAAGDAFLSSLISVLRVSDSATAFAAERANATVAATQSDASQASDTAARSSEATPVAPPPVIVPPPAPDFTRGPSFFCAEVEVFQPGSPSQPLAWGRGSKPRGALTMLPETLANTGLIRASDMGYRTREDDVGGLQVYPAVLDTAFEIDRQVSLDPGQPATATFGAIRLNNLGQRFDAFTEGRNSDSRPVRIMLGEKLFDPTRGILLDPPRASLQPFFTGTALNWQVSETEVEIPLQDATYWADRPLQSNTYAGTGGLNGTPEMTGRPIPITRGGDTARPVQNVPMTVVDPVQHIYQWTDAPGVVVTLYEGGVAVFAYEGDVPDLYAGTPPTPGRYRTNNARGVLQMGSRPVRALTADVTGAFALAGPQSLAADIARYLLTETMAQPEAALDLTSFQAAQPPPDGPCGFHASEAMRGLDAVRLLLGSIGARLLVRRNGLLGVFALRAVPAGTTPAARLSSLNAIDVVPQPLPSTLDPPPYRWRVGWGRNHTVQTSELNGAISGARKQFLAEPFRLAAWAGPGVLTAYRRPNDPAPVETALLVQSDAVALARVLGALWEGRPGLYAVTVPLQVAAGLDIGSVVLLQWPLRALAGGQIGQVVGEQVRSVDGTVMLLVLCAVNAGVEDVALQPLGVWDQSQWDEVFYA